MAKYKSLKVLQEGSWYVLLKGKRKNSRTTQYFIHVDPWRTPYITSAGKLQSDGIYRVPDSVLKIIDPVGNKLQNGLYKFSTYEEAKNVLLIAVMMHKG